MNPPNSEVEKIRRFVQDSDLASILELAHRNKRVLSWLTALTYDPDPVMSDRALSASGLAAQIIYQRDAEFVRNYLLRLFWLVNDESGGIGWRAPELIGEILYHCPQLNQFFPLLISLLDLEPEDSWRFLPGILWAIGRVAQVDRVAMQPALPRIQSVVARETDPALVHMAHWCLQQLNDP